MSFPVEYSNRPSNSITSLPQGVSQSGYDGSFGTNTLEGFSIRARRTLMQRTRVTHPRLLNRESVPQNVPGGNPKASLWTAWEHTNSIIPDQFDPQSWDRYSYVRNNPVNNIDPTGHATCEDMPWECDDEGEWLSGDPNWKSNHLWYMANQILEKLGGKDDLEAMAQIIEVAASLFNTWDELLPSLSDIFLGFPRSGPETLAWALVLGDSSRFEFKDTGFHPDFRDKQNQVFHFWGYVSETADQGLLNGIISTMSSAAGNYFHEIAQSVFNIDAGGTSWQDFSLAVAGIEVGKAINGGAVSITGLGDYVRDVLDPSGPGSNGMTDYYTNKWGPLRGQKK